MAIRATRDFAKPISPKGRRNDEETQVQELHLCSLLLELAVEILVAAPGAYAQLALRDDPRGLCHPL